MGESVEGNEGGREWEERRANMSHDETTSVLQNRKAHRSNASARRLTLDFQLPSIIEHFESEDLMILPFLSRVRVDEVGQIAGREWERWNVRSRKKRMLE